MDFKEISEKAYKKEGLGKFKNIAEKYAYVRMENLYMEFKNENINLKEAEKCKNEIEREYKYYLDRVDKYYEVFKNQNEIRKRYESFLREIEKSQDTDSLLINSLKLIEEIVQDNSFYERNYNKIKNN